MTAIPRVLIVDDQELVRRVMSAALQGEFEVHEAADGEAALAEVERHFFDVIVLDVALPDMDGYSICRRIRAMPRGQESVIVFCTGRGGVTGRLDGVSAGADAYLVKPVAPEHLRRRVRELAADRLAITVSRPSLSAMAAVTRPHQR